ncbi:MAG: hypothetical protein JW798_11975 [Prolixibacteraceae bacterium]|nr:hypothetical protein [Prolixibacteraceae bacterium]
MLKLFSALYFPVLAGLFLLSCNLHADPFSSYDEPIIIDHNCTRIEQIPVEFINKAREDLKVVYGHTSHGSQLISGMDGLDNFMQGKGYDSGTFGFNWDGSGGALLLHDAPFDNAYDLGNPNFSAWASDTRQYLNNHPEINVVMWSWCGQVSWASDSDMNTYLSLMNDLEAEFENVVFVYMTGHLDGGGIEGTLNRNNNKIRDFCNENNKILYDFADIESYDPDGQTNYMALYANDNCDYTDSGGEERNWATEWQQSHTKDVDWYSCSAAHSQALNGNLKAYAAWWLFARLAGWNPDAGSVSAKQFVKNDDVDWHIENGNIVFEWGKSSTVYGFNFYDSSGKMVYSQLTNERGGEGKSTINLNGLNHFHQNELYIFRIITPGNRISGKFAAF